MDINTTLLYLNFLLLIINARFVYISYKRNKLVNLIYYFVFLFLVTGQSLNISLNLQLEDEVLYGGNRITAQGHLLSSIFLLYCMCIFGISEYLYKKRNQNKVDFNLKKVSRKIKFSFSYYLFNWVVFFFLTTCLVVIVGFNSIIEDTRPGASGSTFILIGLSLCIYPFIIKLISNASLNWKESVLFLATFLVTLLFSRMIAVFHLMVGLVAAYYSVYSKYKIPLKKYKNYFITIPIVLVVFFFGYGTWRHLKNFSDAQDLPLGALIQYAIDNPEHTLFSIDVNYKISIEGISGLSGIFTKFCEHPFIQFDGGLSVLSALITAIPSFFRGPFLDVQEYINSSYWYEGSVVGSGIEGFFVHFSFVGLIIYPVFLSWFFNSINKKVSESKKSGTIKFSELISYVFIIWGLLIIRGTTSVCVFFLLVNYIIARLAMLIFVSSNSHLKSKKIDPVVHNSLHIKNQ